MPCTARVCRSPIAGWCVFVGRVWRAGSRSRSWRRSAVGVLRFPRALGFLVRHGRRRRATGRRRGRSGGDVGEVPSQHPIARCRSGSVRTPLAHRSLADWDRSVVARDGDVAYLLQDGLLVADGAEHRGLADTARAAISSRVVAPYPCVRNSSRAASSTARRVARPGLGAVLTSSAFWGC